MLSLVDQIQVGNMLKEQCSPLLVVTRFTLVYVAQRSDLDKSVIFFDMAFTWDGRCGCEKMARCDETAEVTDQAAKFLIQSKQFFKGSVCDEHNARCGKKANNNAAEPTDKGEKFAHKVLRSSLHALWKFD